VVDVVFSWFGDAGGQGRELEDEFDAARFFIRLVERDVFVLFLLDLLWLFHVFHVLQIA
jgi:hypothetical protein